VSSESASSLGAVSPSERGIRLLPKPHGVESFLLARVYLQPCRLAASAALIRRVEKVVGYPPLVDMDDRQRREFHEALLDANSLEDLPGKWQAAILDAEGNRPKLRLVSDD
jgi:hypothetical protein